MKWIEVVQLRASERNQNVLESRLKELVKGINRENGHGRIMIFRRTLVPMDYSIHLVHHDNVVENQGSSLGLQLAAALKEFGLVNHSIWKDVTSQIETREDEKRAR